MLSVVSNQYEFSVMVGVTSTTDKYKLGSDKSTKYSPALVAVGKLVPVTTAPEPIANHVLLDVLFESVPVSGLYQKVSTTIVGVNTEDINSSSFTLSIQNSPALPMVGAVELTV